jgi:hypothetical protein
MIGSTIGSSSSVQAFFHLLLVRKLIKLRQLGNNRLLKQLLRGIHLLYGIRLFMILRLLPSIKIDDRLLIPSFSFSSSFFCLFNAEASEANAEANSCFRAIFFHFSFSIVCILYIFCISLNEVFLTFLSIY